MFEYLLTYNSNKDGDNEVHVALQIARNDIIKATVDLFDFKPMSFGEGSDDKQVVTIPFPKVLKTDVWPADFPEQHSYVLLSVPENAEPILSDFSAQTPPDSPLRQETDRRLGAVYSGVHKTFNLWYGIPSQPSEWCECISWQECFTALFHMALSSAERASLVGKDLVEQLQRAMFHAVAYFLFDDVEVPSLVHNPGLEWESGIYVSKSVQEGDNDAADAALEVIAMYGWTNALWGDPLMECALRTPSKAFLDGYGENPIVFERQETKKLWYLAYAALTSLVQKAKVKAPGSSQVDKELTADSVSVRQAKVWGVDLLKELLLQTAEKLKDAPCY